MCSYDGDSSDAGHKFSKSQVSTFFLWLKGSPNQNALLPFP